MQLLDEGYQAKGNIILYIRHFSTERNATEKLYGIRQLIIACALIEIDGHARCPFWCNDWMSFVQTAINRRRVPGSRRSRYCQAWAWLRYRKCQAELRQFNEFLMRLCRPMFSFHLFSRLQSAY